MVEALSATAAIVSGIGSLRVNNSSHQNMDENILTFQKYILYEAVVFVEVY